MDTIKELQQENARLKALLVGQGVTYYFFNADEGEESGSCYVRVPVEHAAFFEDLCKDRDLSYAALDPLILTTPEEIRKTLHRSFFLDR